DELEVHVHPRAADVAEQPAVSIDPIEIRVDLEPDGCAKGHEPDERTSRRAGVALTRAELRRVDLQQADATTVPQRQRVAVVDGCDDLAARGARSRGRAAERHGDRE